MVSHVAIIGLGLIGGSIALGLRSQGKSVTAFDTDERNLELGMELGVIDRQAASVEEAVKGADLVVLAVPVLAMETVLRSFPEQLPHVITDVGSVKQPILDAFQSVFGSVPDQFVPGHPIAGSEQHGVVAANGSLFEQHRVLLTPLSNTDPDALTAVGTVWQSLGAEVSIIDVAHHDLVLGKTSHLPHLLAYSLIDTLSSQGDSLEIFDYAAGGLRDFSRIAASDPVMWGDIFLSNKQPLLKILEDFSRDLDALRESIETGNRTDLLERLTRSKAARDHFSQVLLERKKLAGHTETKQED
jgi:3-phosphoshikimate 1-carboxyvinyltransferase